MTGLLLSAIALQVAPLDGKDLAAPVSLRLKQVLIADALAILDPATPVTLSIAPNLANLKVTVLVKDQPCGKVLERIADVLMCEWKVEKGGYRLVQSSLVSSQMQAYLAAENRLLRDSAELEAHKLMDVGQGSSNAPRSDTRLQLAGKLLRDLPASAWGGFWRGDVLTGDAMIRDNRTVTVAITFDPIIQQMLMQSSMGPTGVLSGPSGLVIRRMPFQTPPSTIADLPFAKQVREWATPIKTSKDDKSLDLSEWAQPGKTTTLANLLTAVHDQTELPIVAEAFRIATTYDRRTVKDLKSFLTAISAYSNHTVKTSEDWVLVRNGHFWRHRLYEPPEAATVALEKLAKERELNLNDYANYACKLTDVQVAAFRIEMPKVEFETTPLRIAMPALRFFGTLSDRQRQVALAGESIPYQNLTATQRNLFIEAMSGGAFAEADSISWKSGLLSGKAPTDAPLFFRASSEPVYPLGRPRPGGRNTGVIPKNDPNVKIPGYVMQFGISPEKRVGYVLPLKP